MPAGGPDQEDPIVIDKDDYTEDEVLRTIVADDDPLVRRLIRDTLQRADVTVIAANVALPTPAGARPLCPCAGERS